MYMILANMDYGFSGFFFANPDGAFTVGRDGYAWVTNDLVDPDSTLHAGDDVAHSALIQGF